MSKKHLDFKRMLDDTDFSDPSSIERYAANLDGMTFRDILELGIAPEGESAPKDFGSKKYKGGMGTLIEERVTLATKPTATIGRTFPRRVWNSRQHASTCSRMVASLPASVLS